MRKAATLGVGLILPGMGIYFNEPDMLLKVFIIIAFTLLTAPVIGRTAVHGKVRFWRRRNLDEFQEYLREEQLEVKKDGEEGKSKEDQEVRAIRRGITGSNF